MLAGFSSGPGPNRATIKYSLMLDRNFIRENLDRVEKALRDRGSDVDLNRFRELDQDERSLRRELEALRAQRNSASEQIGRSARQGADVSDLKAEMRALGEKVKKLDDQLLHLGAALHRFLEYTPNIPDSSVPVG